MPLLLLHCHPTSTLLTPEDLSKKLEMYFLGQVAVSGITKVPIKRDHPTGEIIPVILVKTPNHSN